MAAFDNLTSENFQLFAAKCYDKPFNDTADFQTDLKLFRYLKRLYKRYRLTGDFNYRLILNHTIVIFNTLGSPATRMLFLKIEKADWSALKTVLLVMSRLPRIVNGVNGVDIDTYSISIDPEIVRILKEI